MVFGYYEHLSPPQKLVYRASDRVHAIRVHGGQGLHPLVQALREALPGDDPSRIEPIAAAIAGGLTERLGIDPVDVQVSPSARASRRRSFTASTPGGKARVP